MNRRIVATSTHPGGANAIAPVIKQLSYEGSYGVLVIGHQSSEKIFQSYRIGYNTIYNFGLPDVSVESMNKLLQLESPSLVLTGTSYQTDDNRDIIEQTMTLAAKKVGIKSLAVLDMWDEYRRRFSNVYTGEDLVFLPDKIAIMDRLAEEAMIKEGIERERLVITGNPFFDELVGLKDSFGLDELMKVRIDLGIHPNAFLIFYGSQPIEHDYGQKYGYTEKTALRELLNAVDSLPREEDVSVLVKVHPRENKRDLEEIARGYGYPIVVDQQSKTRPALLASDVVVSPFSTVLVESSYLDKPSISLQPGLIIEDPLITNKLGVTLPVYKPEEIRSVLESVLFDSNYLKKLEEKRKDFKTDGKATERVAKLVHKMLEN